VITIQQNKLQKLQNISHVVFLVLQLHATEIPEHAHMSTNRTRQQQQFFFFPISFSLQLCLYEFKRQGNC